MANLQRIEFMSSQQHEGTAKEVLIVNLKQQIKRRIFNMGMRTKLNKLCLHIQLAALKIMRIHPLHKISAE